MTPELYMLILIKLGLLLTLTAIVGIISYHIIGLAKKGTISRMVGYYIVSMLVVLWFMGLGIILTM